MMRSALALLVGLTVVACGDDDPVLPPDDTRTYEVTLTNLSASQPISPGIFVVHDDDVSLFTVGAAASAGVQAIAEDGDPSVAETALDGNADVESVATTSSPLSPVGGTGNQSVTVTLTATDDADLLSVAAMLICTNDGFVGAADIELTESLTVDQVINLVAYDAGTEANTEVAGDIVPPCFQLGPVGGLTGGTGRTAESATISTHAGITLSGDLTAAHAWTAPVARITISRID